METLIEIQMNPMFEVLFMDDVHKFFKSIDQKSKEKIIYNIDKARFRNDKELFKKLKDEIWEFRTLYNKTFFRLFAFWDKSDRTETLVIVTHAIIKKTDKTPEKEIEKAELIRLRYFKEK